MFYTEKFCQFCSLLCLAGEEADSVSPVVTALMMMNNFHAHTTTISDAVLQSGLFWSCHGYDLTLVP
jgi:hypothetical protein